jgi:hypothetical protein
VVNNFKPEYASAIPRARRIRFQNCVNPAEGNALPAILGFVKQKKKKPHEAASRGAIKPKGGRMMA